MGDARQQAADLVLCILPLAMRSLAMLLRQNQHGLRASHYGALMMLSLGNHSLTQLAGEMSVSLPTMSNTVSTLEGYGWVVRVRDPKNRRQVIIALSSQGREALQDMQRQATELVTEALAQLSEGECSELSRSLEALRRCLCTSKVAIIRKQEPCQTTDV